MKKVTRAIVDSWVERGFISGYTIPEGLTEEQETKLLTELFFMPAVDDEVEERPLVLADHPAWEEGYSAHHDEHCLIVEGRIEELIRERDEAQRWMRFIADTQHRLLDAFHMELTDEEWVPFAEALGIDPDIGATKETEASASDTQDTDWTSAGRRHELDGGGHWHEPDFPSCAVCRMRDLERERDQAVQNKTVSLNVLREKNDRQRADNARLNKQVASLKSENAALREGRDP